MNKEANALKSIEPTDDARFQREPGTPDPEPASAEVARNDQLGNNNIVPGQLSEGRNQTGNEGATGTEAWQYRLLPTMSRVIVGVTIFFLATGFLYLIYLTISILQPVDLPALPDSSALYDVERIGAENVIGLERLRVLSSLEDRGMERRYHHGRFALMFSIWMNYLGYVTGMILALVGAILILGKLQEQESELHTTAPSLAVTLNTASPGLILALLGVVLMITTSIFNQTGVSIIDAPIYVQPYGVPSVVESIEPYLLEYPEESTTINASPTPEVIHGSQ